MLKDNALESGAVIYNHCVIRGRLPVELQIPGEGKYGNTFYRQMKIVLSGL